MCPIPMNEAAAENLRRDLERDIEGIIKRYPALNSCREVFKQNMARMAAEEITNELFYAQSMEAP